MPVQGGKGFFGNGRPNLKEVPKNARESHVSVYGMQAEKLQHGQEQKEHSRPSGAQQVLPFLPEAHLTQRNQVRKTER